MKKLIWILTLVVLVAAPVLAQDGAWPRTLIDGLGNEVTLQAPPERIVSLTLASDETLLPLIGPERFAAVTALANDPAISNVAVMASQVENAIVSSDDVEQVIGLEPDIVFVASFTGPEVVQQLRDAGLTVFVTGFPIGIEAIQANILLLGQAVGAEAEAQAIVDQMQVEISAVEAAVGDPAQAVTALYLTPGNYTSGAGSSIADIIRAAGGSDVTAVAGIEQFAPVSDEFIIEQDPDVILLTGWTPWDPTFIDTFTTNPAFAGLSAIQTGRVYIANDAHLTSVSQYIAEGVKDMAAYLYPERYPALPLSLTDAAGNAVTVEQTPDVVAVVGAANSETLQAVLDASGLGDVTLTVVAEDAPAVEATGNVLVFSALPQDAVTVSGAESVTFVNIYDGDTPAEVVENMNLFGSALGERVAALNASALYTDALEAAAS